MDWVDTFDNEELAGRSHRLTTVLQDGNSTRVGPVVNHMLQKISIGTHRHFRKEIAAHGIASVGKTELAQTRTRPLDDLWEVEQCSFQLGMRAENADEQGTIAAAHLDHVMTS